MSSIFNASRQRNNQRHDNDELLDEILDSSRPKTSRGRPSKNPPSILKQRRHHGHPLNNSSILGLEAAPGVRGKNSMTTAEPRVRKGSTLQAPATKKSKSRGGLLGTITAGAGSKETVTDSLGKVPNNTRQVPPPSASTGINNSTSSRQQKQQNEVIAVDLCSSGSETDGEVIDPKKKIADDSKPLTSEVHTFINNCKETFQKSPGRLLEKAKNLPSYFAALNEKNNLASPPRKIPSLRPAAVDSHQIDATVPECHSQTEAWGSAEIEEYDSGTFEGPLKISRKQPEGQQTSQKSLSMYQGGRQTLQEARSSSSSSSLSAPNRLADNTTKKKDATPVVVSTGSPATEKKARSPPANVAPKKKTPPPMKNTVSTTEPSTPAKDEVTKEKKRAHIRQRRERLQREKEEEKLMQQGQHQRGNSEQNAYTCDSSDDGERNNDADVRDRKEFSSDDDEGDKAPLSSLARKATTSSRANAKSGGPATGQGRKGKNGTSRYALDDDIDSFNGDSQNEATRKNGQFWGDLQSGSHRTTHSSATSRQHKRALENDNEYIEDPPPSRSGIPTVNFPAYCDERNSQSATVQKQSAFAELPSSNELPRTSLLGLTKQNTTKQSGSKQKEQNTNQNVTSNNARRIRPVATKIIPGVATAKTRPEYEERERQLKDKGGFTSSPAEQVSQSSNTPSPSQTAGGINSARRTRKKRKQAKKQVQPETIEILLSDSEPETPVKPTKPLSPDSPIEDDKPVEDPEVVAIEGQRYELTRIAIGSMVQGTRCEVVYNDKDRRITLVFQRLPGKARTAPIMDIIPIPLTELSVACGASYLSDNDNALSFLSLGIIPDSDEKLARFRSYDPESTASRKKYIVLEFDDWTGLAHLTTDLKETFNDRIKDIKSPEDILEYSESLVKYKEKRKTLKKPPRNPYSKDNDDKLLLVYPFAGDKAKIEAAADGLKEASGAPLVDVDDDEVPNDAQAVSSDQTSSTKMPGGASNGTTSSSDANVGQGKVRRRRHFVTLRVEDYLRLDPGEWLNDSLVDFWMQWISRDDTDLASSEFHFFTSHFYTMLNDAGPESVQSWTAKKGINVFKKKLIFIPINKDLHWSLCVVVNPGSIPYGNEEPDPGDQLPCLIFMDSLKMHNKNQVSKNIRKWLNSEWKRLNFEETKVESPFTPKNFTLFNPAVPYQNNTWDCGVFVCRYAYAVYQLRRRNFTYRDAGLRSDNSKKVTKKGAFYHLITADDEFDFDMGDIARFREEFKILIENLSNLFLAMKNEEREMRRLKQAGEEDEETENALVMIEPTKVTENGGQAGSEAPAPLGLNNDGAANSLSAMEIQISSTTSDDNMEVEPEVAMQKPGESVNISPVKPSRVIDVEMAYPTESAVFQSRNDGPAVLSTSEDVVKMASMDEDGPCQEDRTTDSSDDVDYGGPNPPIDSANEGRLISSDGVITEGSSSTDQSSGDGLEVGGDREQHTNEENTLMEI